jgi:GT2 family glycosyltransferase
MNQSLTVIVPVRNGERTLADCLSSLLRTDFPAERREILVVDNGSSDRSARIAADFPVRITSEPRPGLSHARNRGIEEAGGELLAFTDCDCVVTRSWLRELLAGFAESDAAATVGRTLAFPPRTATERYVARRRSSVGEWSERHPLPYFTFSNAVVRQDVFDRIGLFDPRFRGGSEDIDLGWRFFAAGYERSIRPKAIVFHQHRTSAAGLFRQHVGYGRGQVRLMRKHPHHISWDWRLEARAWRDLGASGRELAAALVHNRNGDRHPMDAYYPYLDLVRKLGQRVGFLRGLVTDR